MVLSKSDKDEGINNDSDNTIKYEETEIPKNNKSNNGQSSNFRGSIWNLPPDRHTDYRRKAVYKFIVYINKITDFLKNSIDFLRVFIYNVYCKYKTTRKDKKIVNKQDNTKSTKNIKSKVELPNRGWYFNPYNWNWHGIMGIVTLFVVVSIAHSAWVIVQGTDNVISLIMALPMICWAVAKLIKQFIKQGDK